MGTRVVACSESLKGMGVGLVDALEFEEAYGTLSQGFGSLEL